MASELMFYTYPSCTSCRKTKAFLQEQQLDVNERHIFRDAPTVDELLTLLALSEDGVDSLLATRSQAFKQLNVDVDELKLSELLKLMSENPKLLKRPILTDGKEVIVGYDKASIETYARRHDLTSVNVS
ncbi:Spx/MgsR family RNA polymerase-binding regulatory protein [Exiguobacterium sp. SH3S2]|uniref:Spx/MgsR family RNA polymerase-binding regulatory protein n=2 Tax=Bacillales Family XII. Incertae Sedis TaxID=539742 RepID=UPI000AB39EB2|nr:MULTISPECIES: Spx/MgsR family RNA polymerase-binding regulatory protein [Exiguobacterium]TCI24670.1 Spx/MgsR family RNA polymerase-binding regulatory protein [Exiguobacterium sp. SH5S4]TCI39618.1 Spx/MgsR family RNA polymerase-binding regulatory protein [Exiguobacterium sp. SH4S7]TCI46280.1 Spx/MgsR family RNA polymerase-binding regulatory protein [Exiguobacterium sp. SH3S3]TCI47687.1 Spx/MgsR family RNA polymerase-binding regulatory protein [Exiguobacterium sp. SH5S32]TCI54572.1 Spx/MgsR f